ncbi:MAG TPA: hypothetical protein VN457_00905, partial [Chlamydiales bacterium]|nr:hypothetical protein [Chlamydiales bacterium]
MQRTPLQYKDCLTNEMLLKRFKSQFDLVRFAIKVAEDRIHSGREVHYHGQEAGKSLATEILEEIADGTLNTTHACGSCDEETEEEEEEA